MNDNSSRVDGARVLADRHALRAIGPYKTGVHKPTFSEPHLHSLAWLLQRLPDAGLAGEIDGIGNVLGTSTKGGPKLLAGSHLRIFRSAWELIARLPGHFWPAGGAITTSCIMTPNTIRRQVERYVRTQAPGAPDALR